MKFKLLFVTIASLLFSISSFAQVSKNEGAAREWITNHASDLKIKSTDTFKLSFVRKSLSGETLRFQQMVNDVPVFESEIVIHFSPDNEISYTSDSYVNKNVLVNTTPSISKASAITISNAELKLTGNNSFQECNLFVYTKLQDTKLVYRVVTSNEFKVGSWETIIDAQTGLVLSTKDIAVYHKKGNPNNTTTPPANNTQSTNFVSGTGFVFNPDPLSKTGSVYGGSYVDGAGSGDVTNTALDNARTSVTIPELEFASNVYKLKGTYAEIKDLAAPSKGLFTQATSAFNFNRNQDGFEAVNAYYHIDKNLRYINLTLGIPCVSLYNSGVLFYDPSAESGADNSHYSSGQLHFGEGGVDDAEDADVILHELGHGIHDWITGGHLSQVNGLSEGFGDYWAVSYSRSLNQWASNTDQYNYVFSWDGHNPFWPGRMTDTAKLYPADLDGEVHDDGEIWAAAGMEVFDAIGRTKSDMAMLEGLSTTTSSTNQQNAAIAVRQAAINMNYPCSDIQLMTGIYTNRGYTMPSIAFRMGTIADQTVQADATNTYTLPSYATLANPITNNCDAGLTQSPVMGTILAPGVYTITMVATSGTSTINRTFQLTITPFLGVSESVKNHFVLYPNPANNVLNVKGDFDSNESVIIYNMLGQTVMKKAVTSNEESIDIASLAKGVYNLYFTNAKVSYKFIKN
ncbi:T9SS type A sorting domain-containing protein [Flavobacterium sp. N1994]|uniref:T9SS type A sorting domain-containing protein n=1 Tax=Flavobacterium sp. N1994 TaxID=2986827 RepID=UPI002221B8CD|nr:T9SS type A sorting domain-containing protein [Flavobacterium sp. N1994]